MPRIPRLGRGEQDDEDAPAEQQTQVLTPGDPLGAPAPPPASPTPPADAPPADAPPADAPPADASEPASTPGPTPAASGSAPGFVSPLEQLSSAPAAPPASTSAVVAAPSGPGEEAAAAPAAAAHDGAPGFRERTRMRRRLRELRRLREIAFRDLGGLTFDLHRFGRDRQDLVARKLEALGALDAELRALETALDDRRPFAELREPGIAACPHCATLHGTDASFCPGCGTPLRGAAAQPAS